MEARDGHAGFDQLTRALGGGSILELIQVDLSLPVPAEFTACLSQAERARARSFHFDHLQIRYLAAHVALRCILSRHLNRAPSEVTFLENQWGKPSTPGGPYFNLTHSDDVAVIAVDREHEVGVDLETGSLLLRQDEMGRVLSPDEASQARKRDLSGTELLRLWVRKEAVLKSLGKGVAYDPSRTTVGFHAPDFDHWRHVSMVDDGARQVFHLIDVRIGDMYCAVARRGESLPDGSIALTTWSPESAVF